MCYYYNYFYVYYYYAYHYYHHHCYSYNCYYCYFYYRYSSSSSSCCYDYSAAWLPTGGSTHRGLGGSDGTTGASPQRTYLPFWGHAHAAKLQYPGGCCSGGGSNQSSPTNKASWGVGFKVIVQVKPALWGGEGFKVSVQHSPAHREPSDASTYRFWKVRVSARGGGEGLHGRPAVADNLG